MVHRSGLFMTRHGSFKKVVRCYAAETGQRYTEVLTDLEGIESGNFHSPPPDRLRDHPGDTYGIDITAVTHVSQHSNHVRRID